MSKLIFPLSFAFKNIQTNKNNQVNFWEEAAVHRTNKEAKDTPEKHGQHQASRCGFPIVIMFFFPPPEKLPEANKAIQWSQGLKPSTP